MMLKGEKKWCDDHKTWMSDNLKYVIWSDELSFTMFSISGQVYIWGMPKEAYNPAFLAPTVNYGDICDDLGSNILVFCWSYNYSEWLNYCQRLHGHCR